MSPATSIILGAVCGLIATIVLMIMVYPKSKDGNLPPFLQKIHDIIHFKNLVIEKILKILYTLATTYVIFAGFFMLFARETYWGGYSQSYALYGILTIVFGPIIIRLGYELLMMSVLLVQNVIDINKKLTNIGSAPKKVELEKVVPPHMVFCTQCGTNYDCNAGDCPSCGKK